MSSSRGSARTGRRPRSLVDEEISLLASDQQGDMLDFGRLELGGERLDRPSQPGGEPLGGFSQRQLGDADRGVAPLFKFRITNIMPGP
ncbi:MAG: hypothetical protein OXG37_14305 [Actinomycetia bacterium]|nr:hypothetical protein [Actinomycetes bacterium]